jgi:hypothetical protein
MCTKIEKQATQLENNNGLEILPNAHIKISFSLSYDQRKAEKN